MKKYILNIAVSVALFIFFNIIAFTAYVPYNSSFWLGYGFVSFAFLFNIAFLYFLGKRKENSYAISAILINSISVAVTCLLGTFMVIIPFPVSLGTILLSAAMLFTVISTVVVCAAANSVTASDKKIHISTYTITELTSDAEHLLRVAEKNPKICLAVRKVYSALRYSDPVSSPAVYELNELIRTQFDNFAKSVAENDGELCSTQSEELVILIDKRNKKCALFK